MARNLDEVKAWLTPQLMHGPLEVALVGDFDVDAAIAAAAKTIGALPPREPKPALAELKKVKFPADPFTKNYVIDRATAFHGQPSCPQLSRCRRRRPERIIRKMAHASEKQADRGQDRDEHVPRHRRSNYGWGGNSPF